MRTVLIRLLNGWWQLASFDGGRKCEGGKGDRILCCIAIWQGLASMKFCVSVPKMCLDFLKPFLKYMTLAAIIL